MKFCLNPDKNIFYKRILLAVHNLMIKKIYKLYKNLLIHKIIHMESTSDLPFKTGLKLKNSLTGKIEQFIPAHSNKVNWYTCGPTVYSHSHLGHARNYICNDNIRRILRDYFNYDVKLVMNVTDIDDKIINKSIEEKVEYYNFAKKWQNEFFEDMRLLNVETADAITRVTQYVPNIVSFIEKIIDNGFAYQSNGSVYFDIEKYRNHNYTYGKLRRNLESETETAEEMSSEKRNKDDFVLWKKAKEGEPTWDSKWGLGRPGWHIQCSAMASNIFGQQMDLHSGGIDLIFPHHQNELAQSQAFFCKQKWVRYFIHVGHLHIQGLKMSKKLKNFITIKQMLTRTSARVLRLFFAMHQYDATLNFNAEGEKDSLTQSTEKDKKYKNFFNSVRSVLRNVEIKSVQKWSEQEIKINSFFETKKSRIHFYICNNIDSGNVFTQIDQLVKAVNIYIEQPNVKFPLLNAIHDYLIKIFKIFGLDYSAEEKFDNKRQIDYMNLFTRFRDQIRANAKSDFKVILEICDKFRDYDLVELGIRLEDKKIGERSIWKEQNKQILIKERQAKEQAKKKKQQQAKQKQEQRLNKMKVNPRQMFKVKPEYTQFDENGVPTHIKQKEVQKPLNEKTKQKLRKDWNKQEQLYQQYLKLTKKQ